MRPGSPAESVRSRHRCSTRNRSTPISRRISDLALRILLDVLGVGHVVLGSKYPFHMGLADPNGEMMLSAPEASV